MHAAIVADNDCKYCLQVNITRATTLQYWLIVVVRGEEASNGIPTKLWPRQARQQTQRGPPAKSKSVPQQHDKKYSLNNYRLLAYTYCHNHIGGEKNKARNVRRYVMKYWISIPYALAALNPLEPQKSMRQYNAAIHEYRQMKFNERRRNLGATKITWKSNHNNLSDHKSVILCSAYDVCLH